MTQQIVYFELYSWHTITNENAAKEGVYGKCYRFYLLFMCVSCIYKVKDDKQI